MHRELVAMHKKQTLSDSERVTVTLAPGQREILNRIAERNGTTLAFVVRYALRQFIKEAERGQLKLEFPVDTTD
jgi:predicted DNA-binding protein